MTFLFPRSLKFQSFRQSGKINLMYQCSKVTGSRYIHLKLWIYLTAKYHNLTTSWYIIKLYVKIIYTNGIKSRHRGVFIVNVKHIYYDCEKVNQIRNIIGDIINTNIVWKHLVLGVIGDNLNTKFRNLIYSVIMYALYTNSCTNQGNNLIFVPGGQILACKHIILSDLYTWNTILQYTCDIPWYIQFPAGFLYCSYQYALLGHCRCGVIRLSWWSRVTCSRGRGTRPLWRASFITQFVRWSRLVQM